VICSSVTRLEVCFIRPHGVTRGHFSRGQFGAHSLKCGALTCRAMNSASVAHASTIAATAHGMVARVPTGGRGGRSRGGVFLGSRIRLNTGPALMPAGSSQAATARTRHSSVWPWGRGTVTASVLQAFGLGGVRRNPR
jgi:hypothetical protein